MNEEDNDEYRDYSGDYADYNQPMKGSEVKRQVPPLHEINDHSGDADPNNGASGIHGAMKSEATPHRPRGRRVGNQGIAGRSTNSLTSALEEANDQCCSPAGG